MTGPALSRRFVLAALAGAAAIPVARAEPTILVANPIPRAMVGQHDLPGLSEGFIPQGLTVWRDHVYLSGYLWPSPGENACRVYRLTSAGAVTGQRDLPTPCSHAGGMAHSGGRLFLSDTRRLIELDGDALFDQARNPVLRSIPLEAPLAGSFAAEARDSIWLGLYSRKDEGRVWRFSLQTLDALADGAILNAGMASMSVAVPERTQGAAFGPDGALWTTQSGQKFGQISRIDIESGMVTARYPAPTGIEDIGFDDEGFLWASSETGAKRWAKAPAPFPHLYRVDVKKLTQITE